MEAKRNVTQIGLDIHRTFSVASARDAGGQLVWRRRLEHRDRLRLRRDLRRWPSATPVILEGSFGWSWLVDEVSAAGLEPHLASSRKVAAWREARGLAKSNRTDADLLAELWTQQPRWWEVWLPPGEVRSLREWFRFRMALVRTQTGVKNRIHAVLHRHGILWPGSDLFGGNGRRFLSRLLTPKSDALTESGRAVLKGYLQLLDHVRRQIAQVTRVVRSQVRRSPVAERLRSLPGVDYILAHTLMAEIGQIERFPSSRHLVSYSLLAPRAKDSGEPEEGPPQGRHVGFMGRRTLKWAWIEAAHGAVLRGGTCRVLFDRRTDGGKRDRNRGYIAVARHLCQCGYVLWRKGDVYREHALPRPGSRRRRRRSRPGTGQPDDAMVVAACGPPQASL